MLSIEGGDMIDSRVRKRWAGILTLSGALMAFAGFVGYRCGVSQGGQSYLTTKRATLGVTLSAMEKFRENNLSGGLKLVENHCYSTALSLMTIRGSGGDDFVVNTLLPDLIGYRRSWATNQTEWTKTERDLESLINGTKTTK